MDFVSLERSPRKNKRFVFEYKDGDKIKKIHFGYEGGSTYRRSWRFYKKEKLFSETSCKMKIGRKLIQPRCLGGCFGEIQLH
jgi:hypothetical protein